MAPSRLFALVLQPLSLVTKKKTSRTQGTAAETFTSDLSSLTSLALLLGGLNLDIANTPAASPHISRTKEGRRIVCSHLKESPETASLDGIGPSAYLNFNQENICLMKLIPP
jgi:hypothetical protein